MYFFSYYVWNSFRNLSRCLTIFLKSISQCTTRILHKDSSNYVSCHFFRKLLPRISPNIFFLEFFLLFFCRIFYWNSNNNSLEILPVSHILPKLFSRINSGIPQLMSPGVHLTIPIKISPRSFFFSWFVQKLSQ